MADEGSQGSRSRLSAGMHRIVEETGLKSLYGSAFDVKILCVQRFVRQFAYGISTLILVSFFTQLRVSEARIGLFMTLTLAGDIVISFFLTLFADAIGRRAVLALGAGLMTASGIVFALFSNYWILLAAAVLGVISPSGNEIGPFRAVEESALAHLSAAHTRAEIYAWYSLIGTSGAALGILTCGWVVHHLHNDLDWDLLTAYRLIYYVYACVGILKVILALSQSSAVEADEPQPAPEAQAASPEREPLLRDERQQENREARDSSSPAKKPWFGKRLLPKISPQSRSVIVSLSLLFALDSFASGLVSLSWLTYFFRSTYGLEEGKLGSIFFVTSIIAACSTLVAASLAKRIGNVKTMVFTHTPSAIFLAMIPLPNNVQLSTLFLILRSCTQSMDIAPRSAFLAAIILPSERTAILGFVNVVKTLAQSLGPLITGVLANSTLFWVSFLCAGCLKVCYDLGILALFKNHERAKEQRSEASPAP